MEKTDFRKRVRVPDHLFFGLPEINSIALCPDLTISRVILLVKRKGGAMDRIQAFLIGALSGGILVTVLLIFGLVLA